MSTLSVVRHGLATLVIGGALGASPSAGLAQDAGVHDKEDVGKAFPARPPYSPYAGRTYPTRPFFGDTHLHTAFSMDAGAFGARLGPRDAFRFARGEEVTSKSGQPVKLSRPLDFLVVADHSDGFGFFPLIVGGDPAIMADPQGRKWNEMIHSGQGRARPRMDIIRSFGAGTISKAIFPVPGTAAYRGAWQETIKAAEAANEPGPLHRLHRLRVDVEHGRQQPPPQRHLPRRRDKARQVEPYTTMKPLGSDDPTDLWKWMTAYEEKTGGDVLAIAHNGNLSNGRMFPIVEAFGQRDRPRVRRDAREVGAALRGDADEGDGRGPPLPVAQRRVRRLRDLGQGQPRPAASPRRRRCCSSSTPARPSRTASSWSRSSARTPTSSAWSAAATRTRASPPWRRRTSSARPPRRSRARSA